MSRISVSTPSQCAARDTRAAIPIFEATAGEEIDEAQTKSTNDKVRYESELPLGPS